MIEEFKKLKIKGGIFQEETTLDLFIKNDKIYPNVSIIYGKNGSGKTTIEILQEFIKKGLRYQNF